MHYRPEIDGLRAVAVVPVILFHAGLAGFAGGFVGVDVFFVISGYLITSILLRERAEGQFSLLRFWERRARRILPALYVVMLACIPLAWAVMLPGQYLEFARSLVAVGLFVSNILFWRESDYFAAAAEEKPLLHTWSLSVEEQFYILFPLMVALVWRFGRRGLAVAFALVLLASLALSEIAAHRAPAANFYLLPTRAWELMAGALCALWLERRAPRPNDLLAGAGLAMILAAVVLLDGSTPFPGLWALLPVGGTVLVVLFAAPGTVAARLLSLRAVVGIGLISYSAYLWHQPLFAFARLTSPGVPAPAVMLGLSLLALVLAALTWWLVETPFRDRKGPFRGLRLGAALVPALALLLAVGVHGHVTQGAAQRLDPDLRAILALPRGDTSGCRNRFSPAEIEAGARCLLGTPEGTPRLAVIGDSHAAGISDALAAHLAARGESAVMVSGNWCAPLVNFATQVPRKSRDCLGRTTAAVDALAADDGIETVILMAQWSNYTTGSRAGDSEPAAYTYAPVLPITDWNTDLSRNPEAVAAALEDTLSRLQRPGRQVVIVLPVPEYDRHVPETLVRARLAGWDEGAVLSQPRAAHEARHRLAHEILAQAAERHGAVLVDPATLYCDDRRCAALDADGVPLYEDAHHLSRAGADRLVRLLADPHPLQQHGE